jgi:hypothetical protein
MSRSIPGKLTLASMAVVFFLTAFPALAASAPPDKGKVVGVSIPLVPEPAQSEIDEVAALGNDFIAVVTSAFWYFRAPIEGWVIYGNTATPWWVQDWDGDEHVLQLHCEFSGEFLGGVPYGPVSKTKTYTYTDNLPYPLALPRHGQPIATWVPMPYLKKAEIECWLYLDGALVDYLHKERDLTLLSKSTDPTTLE